MKRNDLMLMFNKDFELDNDLIELIPGYLINVKKDYFQMGESLVKNDLQAIDKIVHKIKGSAKSYGFDFIDELMPMIQIDIKEGGAHVEEYYVFLGDYLDKIEKKLSKKQGVTRA